MAKKKKNWDPRSKIVLTGNENKVLTTEEIVDAIVSSHGLMTNAAVKLGTNYPNLIKLTRGRPELSGIRSLIDEMMLDFAEGCLFRRMNEGSDNAIIFYLRTKGRVRGYVEEDSKKKESESLAALAAAVATARDLQKNN